VRIKFAAELMRSAKLEARTEPTEACECVAMYGKKPYLVRSGSSLIIVEKITPKSALRRAMASNSHSSSGAYLITVVVNNLMMLKTCSNASSGNVAGQSIPRQYLQ
jgi:hypothetical protein